MMPPSTPLIDALSVIALGFLLGIRHATDADHVIAVTTIVSRERSLPLAAWIGALWGVGHTVTIVLIGTAIVIGGWAIPDRLGLAMELAVGVMLILLGLPAVMSLRSWIRAVREERTEREEPEGRELREQREAPAAAAPTSLVPHTHTHAETQTKTPPHAHAPAVHAHPHVHGDYVHSHAHAHDPERHPHAPDATPLARLDRRFGRLGAYQVMRPLVVGIVHGLAGSAAVALLVLATIREPRWAIAYLLVFGLGTVAGMVCITLAIAAPFAYTNGRHAAMNHGLRAAAGLLSIGFGLFLAYRIGIVDGLFTGAAR